MPDRRSCSRSEQGAGTVNITTEQLAGALRQPRAYPHTVAEVGFQQTQMSLLFFAGDYVYKVKKPVNLGYLDYSTLETRKRLCEQEVTLNRRLCGDTYVGVVPIVRMPEGLRVEGEGTPLEYAVKMRRLPADRMLDELLSRGDATEALVGAIARRVAVFHENAETNDDISTFGAIEAIKRNTDENFEQTLPRIGDTISQKNHDLIRSYTDAFLEDNRELFARRVVGGRIRDCHGDLHAAHVCMTDPICIYDCIEFNDRFRYGDVASEVAFLAMDLDQHRRGDLSGAFANAYVEASGDSGAGQLMDFYKCYRAFVRGKVEGFKLGDPLIPNATKAAARKLARRYFLLAEGYAVERGTLVIMMGLAGSGKSSASREAAELLSGKLLSSDIMRKRLAGVGPDEQVYVPFGEAIYTAEWNERTYAAMMEAAEPVLASGGCAILDASFLREHQRQLAYELGGRTGARMLLVECDAPEDVLRERLVRRIEEGAVSDGRPEILDGQLRVLEPARHRDGVVHTVINTNQYRQRTLEDLWKIL